MNEVYKINKSLVLMNSNYHRSNILIPPYIILIIDKIIIMNNVPYNQKELKIITSLN